MDDRALAAAIDNLPSALNVWHDGPAALPRLLSMCILERLREADTRTPIPSSDAATLADSRDRWRHATATIVTWHSTYGLPEATPVPAPPTGHTTRNKAAARRARRRVPHQGTVTVRDYTDAITLAAAWWELDPIRVGLRTGDMTIGRRDARHVRLHNHRRAEIEVLDIILAQVTSLPDTAVDPARLVAPAPGFGHERVDPLIRWLQDNALPPEHLHHPHGGTSMGPRHPDAHLVVNAIPSRLRNQAWAKTEEDLREQSTTVAEDTDVGGLSLAAARTCYAFLITQLNIHYAAGVLLGTPELFLWAIQPRHLVTALRNRVTEQEALAFVDLCTHHPGRSPISAPLLRHGDQLLIPAELVSPVAFERTLLRAASANPSASGRLGNVLGKRGERWQQRLATIPGCEVAAEVRIRDQRGRSAGDLDVVAWDRDAHVMLIVETKWPVDAATLIESNKVDATFDKGRSQLDRIRAGLDEGSIVIDWPPGWDDPLPETAIHWWVGSAQQLDSRPQPDDDITTTSLRLVETILPAHSLSDLVTRLAGFPLPNEGIDFHLTPRAVRSGPLTLTYDVIQIADGLPAPPRGRRVHLGWT